jgi:hypothetical protein
MSDNQRGAFTRPSAEVATARYREWAHARHADNPELATKMTASFASFARRAERVLAANPDAKFAMVEFQPLAAHARPSQQHYNELKAAGYEVFGVSGSKGQGFARQHYMEETYEAGRDWLADPATQDALLRVRAQEGNDAFCKNLYPKFAAEQAKAMLEGASKFVEFLGPNLAVMAGDVSSGTTALLEERYGAKFGIERFAIDNGLGPGYEKYGTETNEALNEVRRAVNEAAGEVVLPELPVDGPSATCTGKGGVYTPFAPGPLYENGGQGLNLHGFRYVDPVRKGDSATSATPKLVFPVGAAGPLFYGTGTSSGGTSAEIAELLHGHNIAMIRAFQRVAMERGARVLIAVGRGKMGEYAHLANEPYIRVATDPSITGFEGTEPGVFLVEFGDQVGAYREIAQNIADGNGGGIVSHGGAGTIKESTSDQLPAMLEVMGFPTFADQQYNIEAMASRGVFLRVQGDTVQEWTQSIYENAIRMLDHPGERAEATRALRAELDAQPPLGDVYREFLGGPVDDPHSGPAVGTAATPSAPLTGGSTTGSDTSNAGAGADNASGADANASRSGDGSSDSGDKTAEGSSTSGASSRSETGGTSRGSGTNAGSHDGSGTSGASSRSETGGTSRESGTNAGTHDGSGSDTSGGDGHGSGGSTAEREPASTPGAPETSEMVNAAGPAPVERTEVAAVPAPQQHLTNEGMNAPALAEREKAAKPESPAPVAQHEETVSLDSVIAIDVAPTTAVVTAADDAPRAAEAEEAPHKQEQPAAVQTPEQSETPAAPEESAAVQAPEQSATPAAPEQPAAVQTPEQSETPAAPEESAAVQAPEQPEIPEASRRPRSLWRVVDAVPATSPVAEEEPEQPVDDPSTLEAAATSETEPPARPVVEQVEVVVVVEQVEVVAEQAEAEQVVDEVVDELELDTDFDDFDF